MITPKPVGISIIARRMPLCVLLNITEKQAERANATLNANPCQFVRDACFLLPVYQHVHLTLSAPNYRREQKYLSCMYVCVSETDAGSSNPQLVWSRWEGNPQGGHILSADSRTPVGALGALSLILTNRNCLRIHWFSHDARIPALELNR